MELVVQEVTKKFGNLTALNRCSLRVSSDGIYGLVGPNGSGKTTLFNIITGFLYPDSGTVVCSGKEITRNSPASIARRGIVRTFQLPRVFSNLTVYENLEAAPHRKVDERRIGELLKMVQLSEFRNVSAGKLSYGQKKQLELARALILDPSILLLDEPTSGLEPNLIRVMIDQIRYARGLGKGIFIIEHNMNVITNLAEKIFVLHNGSKIAEGRPSDIRTDRQVIDAYLGE